MKQFLSKVEGIAEESPKSEERISRNRIIDGNILGGIFAVMAYLRVQFISSLWKIGEKKQGLSSLYLKCSTSSYRCIRELSKDTKLKKCLHGKTQNGTIWEHIPKNTFVTLPNLEIGAWCCSTHQHWNESLSINLWET